MPLILTPSRVVLPKVGTAKLISKNRVQGPPVQALSEYGNMLRLVQGAEQGYSAREEKYSYRAG